MLLRSAVASVGCSVILCVVASDCRSIVLLTTHGVGGFYGVLAYLG